NDLVRLDTLDALKRPLEDYLGRTFRSQTITIIRYSREGPPVTLQAYIPDTALSRLFAAEYHRIGYMLDPFCIMAFGPDEFTAHQLREIAPDRFETSEYHAHYYARTGLIDELGATLRLGADAALHLSLGRTRGNGRFRANEVKYFRQVSPIVLNRLRAVTHPPRRMPELHSAPDLIDRYQTIFGNGANALSRREAEIAALIVQGHSSRAAGLCLGISDQTVKVHRRNIYKKLRISSQNELFSLLVESMKGD
ncbi:hypothetical protein A3731_34830, partial [Roseovarius sp. HI0049]